MPRRANPVLPQGLDLADYPPRVDRRVGAKLVSKHFFPVSPRTMETWELNWRRVNNRALCDTAELVAYAQARVDAAPATRGRGRKAAPRADRAAQDGGTTMSDAAP